MSIKYAQPELKNFGNEYQGRAHFSTRLDEYRAKYTGLFVMCALNDIVRVYALSNAFNHNQVCGECKTEGQVLGGGNISFNPERKSVGVSGRSMDFGSLPNMVLEDYFKFFGYDVEARMFEEGETRGVEDSTRKYFKKHNIEI